MGRSARKRSKREFFQVVRSVSSLWGGNARKRSNGSFLKIFNKLEKFFKYFRTVKER